MTPDSELSRRRLLKWTGGVGASGIVAGTGVGVLAGHEGSRTEVSADVAARLAPYEAVVHERRVPHGLDRRVPAFGHVLAFDLSAPTGSPARFRSAVIAALRAVADISDAVDSTTASAGAAGLDTRAANLQVTPGFGASLLARAGLGAHVPERLVRLPPFAVDALDPNRCHGDLVVQVGAEDPMRLAGAVQLIRSALAVDWRVRWSRAGFRIASAAAATPTRTPRNLMGHHDGTANPALGSPLWESTVLSRESGWMNNGSYLVVRQVRIELDRWFGLDEDARDRVIGRHTRDGAPLGRVHEFDEINLELRARDGSLRIPRDAHVRLADPRLTLGARIYRRSWNVDDGDTGSVRSAGLLFLAWQADVRRGFIPIQRSLDKGHDALARFTRHEGSAVFAVPARGSDEYAGQRLWEGTE